MLRRQEGMSAITIRMIIGKCFVQGNKCSLCSYLLAILPAQRYEDEGDYPKQDEDEIEKLEEESATKEPNKHYNLKNLSRQCPGEGTILPPPLQEATTYQR